ncbi:MAG: NADH-quinone oxidoreductase subunit NuoN [Acidipropionibacterium acidipropionici]|uniref:NADH-quinone oxidoreductase subunit N n=2 Tax=Acidipropionibacterium acidipropionici TaxID=1748 RepID=K7SMJ6_ACIA4|nr:NADH-quinone oxidoreductase subunit NuoN [Acidipropionibacterium acidipropionici]AFV90400.1 NADH-quinone oxidoreductase subunit N [Acidipropionibacterium acidipropionici ATCC 4875]
MISTVFSAGVLAAPPLEVSAPTIEYGLLAPLFIIMGAACVSVLVEALVPRESRRGAQIGITVIGLLAALGSTLSSWSGARYQLVAEQAIALDAPSYATWTLLIVFSLGIVALFAERSGGTETAFVASASTVPGSKLEREAVAAHLQHTEVYPLMMFSVLGMMIFASSNELIVMFLALEIFSLPLYLLCAMARRRRLLSQEAAVKYFLLGALSSAIFLYGTALLYGASGSFSLGAIDAAVSAQPGSSKIVLAGMVMVSVGLLFKVGAVPFHNWVPDVYMGAPSPVTAFMSVATKIAGVVGLTRVLYVGLGGLRWDWQVMLAVVAVATIVVGSLVGLVETEMKRLLAYSSISHAGFILVAVTGAFTVQSGMAKGSFGSWSSVMVYLTGYALATIGMFVIIAMIRRAGGESTELASWAGLGRSHPWLGALVTLFMLSFAGIPLTAGFIGKLMVFTAGWRGGFAWLSLIGILFSLVAAYFYLRVIWVMFFRKPGHAAEDVAVAPLSIGGWIVLIVCALGTLVLGIVPQPLIEMFDNASTFLR